MENSSPACIHCHRTSQVVPLIPLEYQGQRYYICPEHLPILIHQPSRLAGQLPGAENLGHAEGHES